MSEADRLVEERDPLAPPGLVGRGVELRAVDRSYLPFLYSLTASPHSSFRWRFRGAIPTFEHFESLLSQNVHCQFVVVDRPDLRPIGHVVAYGADLANGYASVAAACVPEVVGRGLGVDAVVGFVTYLFHVWPFRKLYFEAPEFNLSQFSSGLGKLYHEEGRLRQHEYFGGRYWDRIVLALYRDEVSELLPNASGGRNPRASLKTKAPLGRRAGPARIADGPEAPSQVNSEAQREGWRET